MKLDIPVFAGSIPRTARHLIKAPYGVIAEDCKLLNGNLSAWREKQWMQNSPVGLNKRFLLGDNWLVLPMDASIANGATLGDHFYVTGRVEFPEEVVMDDEGVFHFSRLGVPCPNKKLSASPVDFNADIDVECYERDLEHRSYAYSFVNDKGYEGSLSPASDIVEVIDGIPVIVSGWEKPEPSWNVNTVRIYRTVSGYDAGKEMGNTLNTVFMFVGECDVNANFFNDVLLNSELTHAYSGSESKPPVAGMKGITLIKATNTYAGFAGNKVYFTRNNEPYNWSVEYALDDNVRGIVESGGNLYVATDGHPYVIAAIADDSKAHTRQVLRHYQPFPMVGAYGHCMIEANGGAIFPSHNGLVYMQGNGPPVVITDALYSPDDWQQLQPDTAVLAVHNEYLFCFMAHHAFAMALFRKDNDHSYDTHFTLSDREIHYAYTNRLGALILQNKDGCYLWQGSDLERKYRWRSAVIDVGVPVNFSHIRVRGGNGASDVKVFADGVCIMNRPINFNYPMSLPLWGTGEQFEIELTGTAGISSVCMAVSVTEMGMGDNLVRANRNGD